MKFTIVITTPTTLTTYQHVDELDQTDQGINIKYKVKGKQKVMYYPWRRIDLMEITEEQT